MKSPSLCLVLLLAYTSCCWAAKVAMMPQFGRSHYLVMSKLADELVTRGHQVSILVGQEAKYAIGKPNVKAFFLPQENQDQNDEHIKALSTSKKRPPIWKAFQGLFDIQKNYCDYFFNSSSMMEEVQSSDVLIGDSLYLCSTLAAEKFDTPHIVLNMSPLNTPTLQAFGISSNPAYVPMLASGLTVFMSLKERIKNLGFFIVNKLVMYMFVYPTFKSVKDKYNLSPEKSIYESLSTVDLIIMPRDFVLDYPQPIYPFVKDVGFFLPSPAKPLPAEIEEFMESSGDEGVVLLSFGSMIDTVDAQTTEMMLKAFSRLPQTFIVKLSTENLQKGSLPANVKAVKWLPQNDILGHEKTKLFITHAGANGLAEAAYHGVPMLCSPFFGDQNDNSQYVKDIGIGEILRVTHATEDQLVSAMKTLLGEKRFREKAARVSRVMRLRKRTPVEDAADLVEYVEAQGHLDHLKPRSLYLPFYQVYMLDVVAVLGAALVSVIVLLVGFVRLVKRMVFKTSRKEKTG